MPQFASPYYASSIHTPAFLRVPLQNINHLFASDIDVINIYSGQPRQELSRAFNTGGHIDRVKLAKLHESSHNETMKIITRMMVNA